MITIDEAIDAVLAAVRPLPAEEVPLLEALGRAAAERIVSPERVPTFDNSAMDGFAVRGAELEAGPPASSAWSSTSRPAATCRTAVGAGRRGQAS